MDIEAALGGPREPGLMLCRIGKVLAQIPVDTPGRDKLKAMLEDPDPQSPDWRTLEEIDLVLRRLNIYSSNKTVANHRKKVCRCYG